MSELLEKFIKGFTECESRNRNCSRFFNRMIAEKKFMRLHPIVLSNDKIDVMVSYSDTDTYVYPLGDDLQNEVYEFVKGEGWHTFISTGFTNDELVEFLPETKYIPTDKFTAIPVAIPTWNDLINAPKLDDNDFTILIEPFELFFGIKDNYEVEIDYYKVFDDTNQPSELELRLVWDDVEEGEKYGSQTTLIFWKGEFIAACSTGINRWRSTHMFYTFNAAAWKDLMHVLLKLSGFNNEFIPGVETIDMNKPVEDFFNVPGFSDKDYGG